LLQGSPGRIAVTGRDHAIGPGGPFVKDGSVPKSLLILDDHVQVAAFVKRVAEDLGYDAIATTTMALFEESFCASPPDEIILDLQLGQDDGIEVLRFLAARQSRARVTLMSGTHGRMLDTARQLAVGLGLNVGQALAKPMRAAALKAALAQQQEGPAPVTAADLAAGIANGEVRLVYQPVVSCATGALVGFEALARWWRPTIGCVFPDSFIPLAEVDPDLMDQLTFSLPARLAEDLPLLDACGFEGRVALNISAQNLGRLDFPERFDMNKKMNKAQPNGNPTNPTSANIPRTQPR
jgi:sensor c-di-GMP phosphodiesterase-like protein